jgi:hypothetical protein
MEKVVHLSQVFKTIFYFKFFELGGSFLDWLKFEQFEVCLNRFKPF